MGDSFTSLVARIFSAPGVPLYLAGGILLFSLGMIISSSFLEYRPLLSALSERWNLLSSFGAERRRLFHEKFAAVDARFRSAADPALVQGWSNFRSRLVEHGEGSFLTSIMAEEAFGRLDEPARSLEWWADIVVAIGLVITFVGIVAALAESTAAMQGGDAGAVQGAVVGLLAIAATKFWTSIAGVLSSILLRLAARARRKRIAEMEGGMLEMLDGCVTFVSPDRALLDQLRALERLESAIGQLAAPRG